MIRCRLGARALAACGVLAGSRRGALVARLSFFDVFSVNTMQTAYRGDVDGKKPGVDPAEDERKKAQTDKFLEKLGKAFDKVKEEQREARTATAPAQDVEAPKEDMKEEASAETSADESTSTAEELSAEFDNPVNNGQLQQEPHTNGASARSKSETGLPPGVYEKAKTVTRQIMYRIASGETEKRICSDMNIAPDRLKLVTNSPLFKAELNTLRDKLRKRLLDRDQITMHDRLKVLNKTALNTLVKMLTAEGKTVSLQMQRLVAKDIIDYNLKLAEANKNGTTSEMGVFITEAFGRAELRKSTMKRPAHLDQPKNLPFSAGRASKDVKATEVKEAEKETEVKEETKVKEAE